MRRWIVLLVVMAAASGGLWVWSPWTAAAPRKPMPLDIYFTCDTSGRIEPCGCFVGQMGGITRVSTALKKAPPRALKLEVGDAIGGTEDFHVMQYRHLLRAFGQTGYNAVNLGRREAKLPASILRDLAANSPVPLISANVLDAATRQPLLRPWLVVEKEGLRVGITGVVDPARLQGATAAGVEIAGIAESLRSILPDMKAKSDVLVCLAFTDESGLEALAREFYEIAIILGGDVRQPSTDMTIVNQSLIYATTNQARALAELHAVFDPRKPGLTNTHADIRLMEPRIAQDMNIAAHSAAYRKEVRSAVLTMDNANADAADRVPGVKPPATYVGSQTCAACHAKTYNTWSNTRHAHAFDTLVRRDSDADPSCIACHVTGFGEPGGYRRSMKADQLVNVGCESCHGPASAHIAERSRALSGQPVLVKMRAVGAGQCIQCHHGEFSRPFQYEEFWPAIAHGKEIP